MNENSLSKTAKVRWLKSQEIYEILNNPPKGLLVPRIPNKPNHGEMYIIDGIVAKRKWKQDGWTYLPRKQGIGFREDNENLRIGGENAITCYYSYIINGLLEGEEKVIVMNRRIYKLFPDGQYFLVHYLKDNHLIVNGAVNGNSQSDTNTLNNNGDMNNPSGQMMCNDKASRNDGDKGIALSSMDNLNSSGMQSGNIEQKVEAIEQMISQQEQQQTYQQQHKKQQQPQQYSDDSSYFSVANSQPTTALPNNNNSSNTSQFVYHPQLSHHAARSVPHYLNNSASKQQQQQQQYLDKEEARSNTEENYNANNNNNLIRDVYADVQGEWLNPDNYYHFDIDDEEEEVGIQLQNWHSNNPNSVNNNNNYQGKYVLASTNGMNHNIPHTNENLGLYGNEQNGSASACMMVAEVTNNNNNYYADNNNNNNTNQEGNSSIQTTNNTTVIMPSYSKLQARILELEQRLMMLELDKKPDAASSGSAATGIQGVVSSSFPTENNHQLSRPLEGDYLLHGQDNYPSEYYSYQQQAQQQAYQSSLNEQPSVSTQASLNNNNNNKTSNNPNLSNSLIPNTNQSNGYANNTREKSGVLLENAGNNNSTTGAMILEEEEQITHSTQQQPQQQQQQQPQLVPPVAAGDITIKVTEYSPEWDLTKGGSKMVLCFLPALSELSEDQRGRFQINFGAERVPAYMVQPGVLKCFVPPHEKGLVKLSIYLGDTRIDDALDKASYFEYRCPEKKKRQKQVKRIVFNQEDEFYRNEFKVRIIDKLNSISNFINAAGSSQSNAIAGSTAQQSTGSSKKSQGNVEVKQSINIEEEVGVGSGVAATAGGSGGSNTKIDETKDMNSGDMIEAIKLNINSLDKHIFEKLLRKLLIAADCKMKRAQTKKWLDLVDETGYGLIHYAIILGFDTALPILIDYDCNLSLQSKNGITPIDLALALNQEKTAGLLIKNGALGTSIGQEEQSNNRGDTDILNFNNIYKNRNILDMLVREVTLHDSINNSSYTEHMSWNDQDQEEDNYLDLNDLCENGGGDSNTAQKNKALLHSQLRQLGKKLAAISLENDEEGFGFLEDEDEEEDEDDEDDDDDEQDDDEEDMDVFHRDNEGDDEDKIQYSSAHKSARIRKAKDNIDKLTKQKHRYLRNYSELRMGGNTKIDKNEANNIDNQSDLLDKSTEMYQSSNYQGRIKTIQKNVRGWLLRRQYLDIKYATRVLQNYIRQKIAKKHIKPECKSMIKNKLIDWLSIKH